MKLKIQWKELGRALASRAPGRPYVQSSSSPDSGPRTAMRLGLPRHVGSPALKVTVTLPFAAASTEGSSSLMRGLPALYDSRSLRLAVIVP